MTLTRDKLITYIATNITTRLLKAYKAKELPEGENFFVAESSICISDYVFENNLESVWQQVVADYVALYLANKTKSPYDLIEVIANNNTAKYEKVVRNATSGITI